MGYEPRILALCCHYCAYAAADLAGSLRIQYPSNVRVLRFPCTGKVEPDTILSAFEKGIDGVLVMTCEQNGCRSLEGSRRARGRVREANSILDEIGLGSSRVLIGQTMGKDKAPYLEALKELLAHSGNGPKNPQRGNKKR